jgi:transcriptional regulator GlxA family with amidase domain
MTPTPVEAAILALPETAGSALYGLVDVLAATGTLWRELSGEAPGHAMIRPRIVSSDGTAFTCGNGIPVRPEASLAAAGTPDLVIVPELWLSPQDDLGGRHDAAKAWLRACYDAGSTVYSACSGSVMLAAAGLLDGCRATSHWGYADLFRARFPKVRFDPDPSLVVADKAGRLVTAGGTTSWHDLALHIIARHASPGEALRIAKVYLLKWHPEGQLPYTNLARRQPHADAVVKSVERLLADRYRDDGALAEAVAMAGIPERTLKRRFKAATGSTLIAYVQNLRIEEAKRLLESSDAAVEEVAAAVGYENHAFFRALFRRTTGLAPAAYRRMFRPLAPGLDGRAA